MEGVWGAHGIEARRGTGAGGGRHAGIAMGVCPPVRLGRARQRASRFLERQVRPGGK